MITAYVVVENNETIGAYTTLTAARKVATRLDHETGKDYTVYIMKPAKKDER